MKRLQSILCASLLVVILSATASAGDITGKAMYVAGDITGKAVHGGGDITGKSAPGDITGRALVDLLLFLAEATW